MEVLPDSHLAVGVPYPSDLRDSSKEVNGSYRWDKDTFSYVSRHLKRVIVKVIAIITSQLRHNYL